MSQSSRRSGKSRAPGVEERTGLRTWAEDRAPVLLAMGILVLLVAILIVISLLHPH
jgi:hypothetical protein